VLYPEVQAKGAIGMDAASMLATHLVGRRLIGIQRREYDWAFSFGDAPPSSLGVSCPWRILVEGRIAFAVSDDGQKFGLSEPRNGEEAARRLLGQRVIERVAIRPDTGDLSIAFSGQAVLEVLNMSSGYEGWQATVAGVSIVGMGGGEIAIYSDSRNG
jgi:hypothetical protein